jgi:hypothetical protein
MKTNDFDTQTQDQLPNLLKTYVNDTRYNFGGDRPVDHCLALICKEIIDGTSPETPETRCTPFHQCHDTPSLSSIITSSYVTAALFAGKQSFRSFDAITVAFPAIGMCTQAFRALSP